MYHESMIWFRGTIYIRVAPLKCVKVAKFDYHIHESHSRDAREASMEKYIQVAEDRGIQEICFTTHLIMAGPDVELGIRDHEIDGYYDGIHRLNLETEVTLKAGLEVDYIPGEQGKVEGVIDQYDWDYILGSVHLVGEWDVGSRRRSPGFFEGRPLVYATDDYYALYKDAIETGFFDMMSHPDYWRRYLHLMSDSPATWEDYGAACVDSIDALKSYGIGIEVNTSGIRHEHGVQYPIREFLEAVHSAGIKKVTIGSDSHSPSHLGFWLPEATQLLKDVGFRNVTSFSKRKPISNPIELVVRTVKNQ